MDLLLYYGFIFVVYGYLGWGLENPFSYCVSGHRQEEGFFYSYFKPMYAFAVTILIYINNTLHNFWILLVGAFIIPTAIEFITGVIMRYYFKKDYWDYSKQKLNYKGLVCLEFSFYWMLLVFFTIGVIQPFILDYIFKFLKPIWKIVLPVQMIVLMFDFILTVNRFKFKRKII